MSLHRPDHWDVDGHRAYSWHQSHDQATVLLTVPAAVTEEDVEIILQRDHIVAGVRGHAPIIKGRLFGRVDTITSSWQLEPRESAQRPPRDRRRNISSTSTVSSQSSYACLSDADVSSSLAASFENVSTASEWETPTSFSSPYSSPRDIGGEHAFPSRAEAAPRVHASPSTASVDSLAHGEESERLLTLHVEKEDPAIWPCLVSGPVAMDVSLAVPGPSGLHPDEEAKYNMDPTSLTMLGLDLLDVRNHQEEAFEHLVRAWRQAHVAVAAMRLATTFVPPDRTFVLQVPGRAYDDMTTPGPMPYAGTTAYYVHMLGGQPALAQLYLEVGLLHLDGLAASLQSSSPAALSHSALGMPASGAGSALLQFDSAAGRAARANARKYFDCARQLSPALDVPRIPDEGAGDAELLMPSVDSDSTTESEDETVLQPRQRRRTGTVGKEAQPPAKPEPEPPRAVVRREPPEQGWLQHAAPAVLSAGTALVAVAVFGVLSFAAMRKARD